MSEPFAELARLDKLVHEPARLAVVSALAECEAADFVYLHRATGLSKGNLSSHLLTLEAAGLVTITKGYADRRPRTWVELSELGSYVVDDYWATMARLGSRWGARRRSPQNG
ncbi:transcriptional regulator [Cellulomonas shaoxiangyii]|uniref:ArsR family transcriptional regulator n=1 Tax=Cellulomonas shaoxiangyii TaxID=2566013 RepID=A0A4P7SNX8_9CELL|nr:transcriptional regulator [Cellulomonas shaoxiangyii]QCB94976.1 ArsR family transcriptional regulator [Cellulomonas shaoxiangyii]TGY79105.1 ArsR family transcriptional regulator [Cellulomonas shaoxiangyii]